MDLVYVLSLCVLSFVAGAVYTAVAVSREMRRRRDAE